MENKKICLSCKTELEEGFVVNMGQNWAKGKPMGTKISEVVTGGEYIVYYKCPKCDLIHPYVK